LYPVLQLQEGEEAAGERGALDSRRFHL